MRWTYRQVGPRYDRVHLTDAELRALCELERSLPDSGADRRPSALHRLRGHLHDLALTVAPLVRLAPWLVPLGIGVMVAFITTSVVVSAIGAVLTACGIAAVVDRLARRLRTRAARRPGRSPRPPR